MAWQGSEVERKKRGQEKGQAEQTSFQWQQ